jgi:hypothetical protein
MSAKIQTRLFIAALSLVASGACIAAPEEIQVYLDEFADQGKFGLDFHTNYVLTAQPGSVTRRMLRVTPELSYGINENWEAGLYWLTSAGPEQAGGNPVTDGIKVRAKWRPKAMTPDSPWYGAINFEVGQLSRRFYPDATAGEIKFIGMYKKDAWTLGANLNVDRALRNQPMLGTNSELDTKLAYRLPSSGNSEVQIGIENYSFLGPVRQQLDSPIRTNSTFLVTDFVYKRWDYNIGLGKANGVTTDRWLVKAIFGMPLD